MAVLRSAGLTEGWYKQLKEGMFYHAHFYGVEENPIMLMDHPTVVPLRSYESVVQSWLSRKKDLGSLESSWNHMLKWCATNEHFPLRIDDYKNREGDLSAISSLVGKTIHVDWSEMIGHGQ